MAWNVGIHRKRWSSVLLREERWPQLTCAGVCIWMQGNYVGIPYTTLLRMSIYTVLSSLLLFNLSCVGLFAIPWTAACQVSLSFTISWSLLKLISLESVMPSNHLICFPLLLLPSIFPSIRVFSKELALCIRWPNYCSLSFNTSPSNEGFPLGLTSLVSLQSKGPSGVFSNIIVLWHPLA